MFDKFKMMGVLAGLMQNKDKLESAAERVKAELAELRVSAEAGSGAVRATVTGELKIHSIELSPALIGATDDTSRETAESMIAEATNTALAAARVRITEIMQREMRELGIDDIQGLVPANLAGLLG